MKLGSIGKPLFGNLNFYQETVENDNLTETK